MIVLDYRPLQQGLRHEAVESSARFEDVLDYRPLQQGLRRCCAFRIDTLLCGY